MALESGGADDGRKARRSRSRLKIVHAFKDLIREGMATPSAPAVAEKAGVGLRTVYRCFEDMGSLYRELVSILHEEFQPRTLQDLETPDRTVRLTHLLANRAAIFAELEPFLLASEAKRHAYKALEQDYGYLLRVERERLQVLLNPDGQLPDEMFEALHAVTSFSFWRRLRIEQGLDCDAASRVMARAARALLTKSPPPILIKAGA
ncbi:TetR/AcrR family transcriptional regulator [Maricaulis sp.]|uniref:TetR/AcrR family transcriptional regulator n=1 Tax=Maricaulis sp. TaxID=1486257 RepID=UPI0025C3B3A7|nr:TetR/AcrR family transcriptional regulator [Maricaulis sp.]